MEALEANTSYELYEELIVDARASVVQGNFRRAVLEMAIACEVTTKQLFFKKATPAGDAFDYLEDKSRINVSVREHSLFFRRLLPWPGLELLAEAGKDPVKGAVVFGAA
jgi:hypothetical protein